MATVEQIIRDIQSLPPSEKMRLRKLIMSTLNTSMESLNERFNSKQQGIHFGPFEGHDKCPACGK
ncbi:hypothetical protein NI470_14420 [Acinetobacter lwoffii]|jgi:hypothetical protein|uniref:hypothetical protein n=1 Tax=Acinetobacter lwoffii TaxID=28090 RepID=UPI0012986FBE|nr:hypothetical protein [Acinetobacter lwoffii]MCO8060494.1 hypothetical protein [Acinetobacter lwoffii]MCO8074747.1 hypothetical protein [Acinetobacter lwoffii]MCO8077754.1 hypothetical protein [Acinetobacter lwoffii]MRA03908.1 hypothetical protein [Acinetobacter lwoffii]